MAIIAVAEWRTNPESVINALRDEFARVVIGKRAGCIEVQMSQHQRSYDADFSKEKQRALRKLLNAIHYLDRYEAAVDNWGRMQSAQIAEQIELRWAMNILSNAHREAVAA